MDYRQIAKRLPWTKGVAVAACDENGLIAADKPDGVLSHPNKKADLGRALLAAPYDQELQAYRVGGDGEAAPTLVYLLNRLDSATSGLVLLCLDERVRDEVLNAFEQKRVEKTYIALAFGMTRPGGLWTDKLTVKQAEGGVRASDGGGLLAETKLVAVRPIPGPPLLSRLTLMPLTGRTHQLRIQTSKRHVPIVGDRTYGDFQKNKQLAKSKGIKRLCLHCEKTKVRYRLKGKEWTFEAFSKAPF